MAEKKFKSHMMYKKCKGVMVKTMEQHLKLKKKGYDEKLDKACKTKGSATAMKEGKPGGKGALDSSRMRGDIPEKPKQSGGGLTKKQKTLPPFLQEKILKAKEKRAERQGERKRKKEERQEKRVAKKEAKK